MATEANGVSGLLEAYAREVTVGQGIVVSSFFDPPYSVREDAPEPVRRWRVRLPRWFPEGSWLHQRHAFVSLEVALQALQESGAFAAIDDLWRARMAESAARQRALSASMRAYSARDAEYPAPVPSGGGGER